MLHSDTFFGNTKNSPETLLGNEKLPVFHPPQCIYSDSGRNFPTVLTLCSASCLRPDVHRQECTNTAPADQTKNSCPAQVFLPHTKSCRHNRIDAIRATPFDTTHTLPQAPCFSPNALQNF